MCIRQSLGQILANDLHGRAITRDLKWGVPVPVSGWEDKTTLRLVRGRDRLSIRGY